MNRSLALFLVALTFSFTATAARCDDTSPQVISEGPAGPDLLPPNATPLKPLHFEFSKTGMSNCYFQVQKLDSTNNWVPYVNNDIQASVNTTATPPKASCLRLYMPPGTYRVRAKYAASGGTGWQYGDYKGFVIDAQGGLTL